MARFSRPLIRLDSIFRQTTVEPLLFLYMWTLFQQHPTSQALIYRKACMFKYDNDSVCEHLTEKNNSAELKYVQTEASSWIMYLNIVYTIPSIIAVMMLLAPWGDRIGRKTPIVIPFIGCILFHVSNLISAIFMTLPIWCLMFGYVLNGISGGYLGVIMAVYSYIGDVVPKESRTVRIAVVQAMIFFAGFFGGLFSGLMLDNAGFVFAYSFLIGMVSLGLIYTIIFLKDVRPEKEPKTALCETVKRTFLDIFKCIGSGVRRKKVSLIIVYLLLILLEMLCLAGEGDILFLYAKLPKFDMTTTLFGYYTSVNHILRGLSVLIILPILRFKLDVKDSTLMYIGLTSKFLSLILLGMAEEIWQLFLVPVIGMLQGFPPAGIRSQLSKSVNKDEQGKIFGIVGTLESVSTFLATVLFNKVYPKTLDFFSGFCFLMEAFLMLCSLVFVVIAHCCCANNAVEDHNSKYIDEHTVNSPDGDTSKL